MGMMAAEPKTLTVDQLNFAREVALYVVSTKTREEAIRIFTDGLKPVRISVSKPQLMSSDEEEEDFTPRGGGTGCRRRCHCRPPSRSMMKRDITTAPF